MLEARHHLIDPLPCIFLALIRAVKIDHGGFESRMTQVLLNYPEIDARFEQMGGIGMPEGMDGDPSLSDSCGIPGLPEGPLDTVNGHRRFCGTCPFPVSA